MFFTFVLLFMGATVITALTTQSLVPIPFGAFLLYLVLNLRERYEGPK
jgi:hypothetical protein